MPTVDACFIGLDLAWAEHNPSGVAALRPDGTLLDVRADVYDNDEVLEWMAPHFGHGAVVVGIDMPTIVTNPGGMRPCERELGADFRRFGAGTHPANLRRFPDGGRAAQLLRRLRASIGVRETLALAPRAPGLHAFETFPHAAHVRLFGLARIFAYKKKNRPWPLVHAEWRRYRAALASLSGATPPLILSDAIPRTLVVRGAAYKAWDDALDAITCAYAASYLWHWGTGGAERLVYGDLERGYIAIPGSARDVDGAALNLKSRRRFRASVPSSKGTAPRRSDGAATPARSKPES